MIYPITNRNKLMSTKYKKYNAFITRNGYVIDKKNITLDELKQLKEELYIVPEVPEEFSKDIKPYPMYHETEETITVPRYYGVKHFGSATQKFNCDTTHFKFKCELRPHQKEIVDSVLPQIIGKGGGLISIPCGGGKTILALHLAHRLGVKTLVLVHKSFLQDQWMERAKEFTNAKLGIIRQSTIDTENKDIVIGMIQSISMRDYDEHIFDQFGLIIVDECHHIASRVFSRALYKTGTQYTIGLSATPKRADGLTRVLYWYLGRTLHKEEKKPDNAVIVRKFNMQLEDALFVEKSQWSPKGLIPSMPKMITNLSKIKRRNRIIINIINTLRKNPKRKILILSGRIAHLEYLKEEVDKKIAEDEKSGKLIAGECRTCYYIGKLKQSERVDAETNGDILFASYEMAQEGFDVPRLNTVILATPKKAITQAIGRVMRRILTESDLKPLIVDVCDILSTFTNQGKSRFNLYKKNGYSINEFMVDNDFIVGIDDFNKGNKILESDNTKLSTIFNEENLDKTNSNVSTYSSNVVRFTQDDFQDCMFD